MNTYEGDAELYNFIFVQIIIIHVNIIKFMIVARLFLNDIPTY